MCSGIIEELFEEVDNMKRDNHNPSQVSSDSFMDVDLAGEEEKNEDKKELSRNSNPCFQTMKPQLNKNNTNDGTSNNNNNIPFPDISLEENGTSRSLMWSCNLLLRSCCCYCACLLFFL